MLDNKKLSSFSRTLANEAKGGAYYTDLLHCKRIGNLIEFPENEFTVLEPSIGDAGAVLEVTKKAISPKIFGVEINRDTYKEKLRENDELEACLCADFTCNVSISHKSFSMCFSNPPYMMNEEDGQRMEMTFHKAIYPYLMDGGLLVWVIPQSVMQEVRYLTNFMARYEIHRVYRFDEKEYAKYKQCVVFALKKPGIKNEEAEAVQKMSLRIAEADILPECYDGEKIPVMARNSTDVRIFKTIAFDAEIAYDELIKKSPSDEIAYRSLFTTDSGEKNTLRPPTTLKPDALYLCAVAGIGAGVNGSVETRDVHLQRGVVKKVKNSYVDIRDGKENLIETETSVGGLTLVEADGEITHLK